MLIRYNTETIGGSIIIGKVRYQKRRKNGNLFTDISDFRFSFEKKKKKKSCPPTPGIEPGPPGWKPGILAIRPRGIA